jgi:2-polyprenyl-6-methoxyphenol hydroxylase-like FAD-dependent oxidoreductase
MSSSTTTVGTNKQHILIIGAGITGLVLAQSLRKRASQSLPTRTFTIYERDPDADFRGTGWGLTIHWALSDFTSLLPDYLIDRLPETFVDAEAVERGETGNFLLFDLQTGEERYRVPPSKRIRVSRERLRKLLMEGLDIQVRLYVRPIVAQVLKPVISGRRR